MPRQEVRLSSDLPNIRVRLEVDEYRAFVKLARLNDRSVAGEARIALRKHLRESAERISRS